MITSVRDLDVKFTFKQYDSPKSDIWTARAEFYFVYEESVLSGYGVDQHQFAMLVWIRGTPTWVLHGDDSFWPDEVKAITEAVEVAWRQYLATMVLKEEQ